MSNSYISPEWKTILEEKNLTNFDGLWNCQAELVDVPNRQGKEGWSEVGALPVVGPSGENEILYIKKQNKYKKRSLRHLISGESTFASEQRNILRFQALGIPALETIFYHNDNHDRAILVTKGLREYISLHDFQGLCTERVKRKNILRKVAEAVAYMHQCGIVHFNLYPKHIYINMQTEDVRFIDLETARRHFNLTTLWIRDLEVLNRRSQSWRKTERWFFWTHYLKQQKKLADKKTLAKRILNRTNDKRERP